MFRNIWGVAWNVRNYWSPMFVNAWGKNVHSSSLIPHFFFSPQVPTPHSCALTVPGRTPPSWVRNWTVHHVLPAGTANRVGWLNQRVCVCRATTAQKVSKKFTHWGWDKMTINFLTTISNAFSWMKIYKFLLRFHWSLFPRVHLTICQHWFR